MQPPRIVKRVSEHVMSELRKGVIRIGSIHYYRSIEDANRKDSLEGLPPISLATKGGNRIINHEQFNKLSSYSGQGFKLQDGWSFELKQGASLKFEHMANIFVFCVSIDEGEQSDLSHKFGTHIYEITNIDMFANMITDELMKIISDKNLIIDDGGYDSVRWSMRPIKYKEKSEIDSDLLKQLQTPREFDMQQVFTKDFSFKEEKELRFVWFPQCSTEDRFFTLPANFTFVDLYLPNLWNSIREIT